MANPKPVEAIAAPVSRREFRVVVVLKEGECSTTDDVASRLRMVANMVSDGVWQHRGYHGAVWGVRG